MRCKVDIYIYPNPSLLLLVSNDPSLLHPFSCIFFNDIWTEKIFVLDNSFCGDSPMRTSGYIVELCHLSVTSGVSLALIIDADFLKANSSSRRLIYTWPYVFSQAYNNMV